ncbi:MAG TPA: hypothetical protein VHU43_02955 [Steroidobacteraceae bacterium]|jgi:hypothetical protein|nr:hypothetical protein [Steroidobacteraceae bacterium]
MNKHDAEQKLEQAMHRAFTGLPLRRAPASLEARVVGELQRRAALPWWRVSFANWPMGARIAFVLICAALVAATILGGASAYLGDKPWNEAFALVLSWVHPFLAVMSSAGGLVALVVRVIPPLWLYGGLGLGVLLYVMLFGLGAAAYRTLYLWPSPAGEGL